jgi:hypothetical protein
MRSAHASVGLSGGRICTLLQPVRLAARGAGGAIPCFGGEAVHAAHAPKMHGQVRTLQETYGGL